MLTIDTIEGQITETSGKMQAILDAADKDTEGRLSQEQRTEYDELEKQFDAAISEKDQLAQDNRRREALQTKRKKADELGIVAGKATADKLSASVRIEPVQKKFASFGEQLQAIAYSAINGRDVEGLIWESLTPAVGGAVANVPSDGGYLIQKDFATEIITRMNELGVLKNRVRTIPIGANSDGFKQTVIDESSRVTGSRWGGVSVYWGAEADAATPSKPKLRMMELELKELIGLAYMTNRLLADASALEAVFKMAFSEEMSFRIDDSLVNGTGAGMPLGFMNSPAKIAVAAEAGPQTANTIVYANVQKMWSRLWAKSRASAVWLINQDAESQLNSMALPVGSAGGQLVYMPPGGVSVAPYATLFGRPVIPTEYNNTLGTEGDIMLVDFNQMLAIEKGGLQQDQSIHVRFVTNETAFRFIYRYDAQPMWNKPLTPFKGSATQSPYITLATRPG